MESWAGEGTSGLRKGAEDPTGEEKNEASNVLFLLSPRDVSGCPPGNR